MQRKVRGGGQIARPIFIIGTQRSGTTLLRLMLDSHERIAVGFETGFMRGVRNIKHVPDYIYGENWYRRYGIEEADMNERIRAFYSGIFSDYARAQGKPRWGEKTPLNLFHMEEMAAIFPDAQFVCIVRHAGAVAASLTRWRYTFDEAIDYWMKANRVVRKMGPKLGPDRYFVCRYEDLIQEPRPTLRRMMRFLDEPWSDNLLRHHEIQAARGGQIKVEGGTRADRALDAASLDSWRERLDAEQLASLHDRPAKLLHYFGYTPDSAIPARPLPVHGRGAPKRTPARSARSGPRAMAGKLKRRLLP